MGLAAAHPIAAWREPEPARSSGAALTASGRSNGLSEMYAVRPAVPAEERGPHAASEIYMGTDALLDAAPRPPRPRRPTETSLVPARHAARCA